MAMSDPSRPTRPDAQRPSDRGGARPDPSDSLRRAEPDAQRALVTGGTGFVGSHLVDELLDAGYRVRCVVRATSDLRWLEGKPVELVEADLAEGDLEAVVAGVDVTFHVAGLTRGSAATLERANVVATRRLVEALVVTGDRHRLVFCSSGAAAGPAALHRPRVLEDEPAPTSDYGRSKLAAETILFEAGERLRTTILRPLAVYGPRDQDTLPVFRMAARGIALIPGLRRRRIQLVHGRDMASALRLAAETPQAVGRTFFVGHPELPLWPEVIAALREAMGRRVLALPLPSPAVLAAGVVSGLFAGGRPGQLDLRRARDMVERAWTADVSETVRVLRWSPVYDVRFGFRHTVRWYLEKGWL
jgi:nucleoside-diphosphate-sugar epimerase